MGEKGEKKVTGNIVLIDRIRTKLPSREKNVDRN